MFWHELGVLAEPITRSFDLDDDRMVKQAIEKCGCDEGRRRPRPIRRSRDLR